MEKYDREMARRVWQRVQGEPPREQPGQNLLAMLQGELMAASTYLMLSRQMSGRAAQVLQRMYREEQNHAAYLKGMYLLAAGQMPALRAPQPVKEPLETALRKCYGAELKSASEYEGCSADPEFGHVFAQMARQEREHCACVLEMIGSLQK